MNLKRSLFKIILSLILTCLALLTAFVFWIHSRVHNSSFGLNASGDKDLIAIFQADREAFEKLQQMAAEDAQRGLYLDAPYFNEGSKFDKSRQQEYEKLMSDIRPDLHVAIDGRDKVVRFIFAGGGTSAIGPGWSKGIEYVPDDFEIDGLTYRQGWQGVVSTNLDNAPTLPANVYIRQLGSDWLLYYQRDE